MISGRHRWGEAVVREHETDRRCVWCGLVRRTRHEGVGWPWVEWWLGGERLMEARTPKCEGSFQLSDDRGHLGEGVEG